MTRTHESDTRVVRSRKALKSALLRLLAEKPFSLIKTNEIAKSAGINRVTFYDHYSTKEELLDEIVDDVLSEYGEIIEGSPADAKGLASKDELYQTITSTVRHIKKHADFYRIMLLTNGVPDLSNRLHEQMSASLHKTFRKATMLSSSIEYDLYIDWIIGGAIGIYKNWLQNGLRQTEEEIAKQMLIITTSSVRGLDRPRIR
ncbi:TetR/AcrR family transcriptional regulator [Cohnella ginsengisoli]|uniref:TetR/AcrR family transcriptional regulator n=1 Tax=Cohnella ginsengisoli TaxID=425004 RepID=A0A9X4KKV2_9BACL|nr:TetR/AcrR family transcriptional regulator [Cohnella ginsengisoli]MDG0793750.1 TetR/AcrR family transcriptional regulator [Cohnella ginsengisoli]